MTLLLQSLRLVVLVVRSCMLTPSKAASPLVLSHAGLTVLFAVLIVPRRTVSPCCFLCTGSVRLLEEDSTFVPVSSVFEQECVSRGSSMEMVIPAFAQRLHAASTSAVPVADARRAALDAVCANEVSELVLSQTLAATLPSFDAFDTLRRRVCQQMALSSFLCHMLAVGDRSLHKVCAFVYAC